MGTDSADQAGETSGQHNEREKILLALKILKDGGQLGTTKWNKLASHEIQ